MKKISYKIIIPITVIIILAIASILIAIFSVIQENHDKVVNSQIDKNLKMWDTEASKMEQEALKIASFCATNNSIKKAYYYYNNTKNLDKATILIQTKYKEITDVVEENSGEKIMIHFHTLDLKSLLRSWTDKKSDDLSGFRQTLKDVKKTNKAVSGFEVGRAGAVTIGVVPIRDSSNNFIGSVECIYSTKNLLNNIKTTGKSSLAVFLFKKSANISGKNREFDKKSNKYSKYRLTASNKNDFKENEISSEEIDEMVNNKKKIEKQDCVYVARYISDYKGQNIGVLVYKFDSTDMDKLVNKAKRRVITIVIIIIIVLIILMYLLLKYVVIDRLEKTAKFADKISKGNYDISLDIKQKDEIGILAKTMNEILFSIKKGIIRAEKIAKGDLTSSKKREKNILPLDAALFDMSDKLTSITENISNVAVEISDEGNKLNDVISEISSGANEQAASTEEISASLEELVATINQNADNSVTAAKLSKDSANGIRIGQKSFENTMKTLNEVAEKISSINDIAEKTDILAINAAIESAQAGEHGKGFSVIAQEIRKLAETSQQVSIGIQKVVEEALVNGKISSNLLLEIVPKIEETANLVQEIKIASNEQNMGSSQINNAVQELTGITQKNIEISENISQNSSLLTKDATILLNSISFFKINKKIETNKENNTVKNEINEQYEQNTEQQHTDNNSINLDLGNDPGFEEDDFEKF